MAIKLYLRALGLLRGEKWLAGALVFAGVAIAVVQLLEPLLFGWVVDALTKGTGAFPLIGAWAALGLFGILAGVVVAVFADRLSHRQRLMAMATAFDRAITMPISYHAAKGAGAVVRTILAGTDGLFWLWLSFLREQLTAIVGIVILLPTAMTMDVHMTLILFVLAIAYGVINTAIISKASGGQAAIERHNIEVFGRVGDVIGNVPVVQSYARLTAESAAMRSKMRDLLAAQYPVLTWWGLLTVLTRSAATISMVAMFAVGATLASRGQITVGQIVSFVAFAGLLIARLDQLSGFAVRVVQLAPPIQSYFDLISAPDASADRPHAEALQAVRGAIAFEDVSFRYGPGEDGVFNLSFTVGPGKTVAMVGPTGSGKTTTLALLQRMRPVEGGRISIDGRDIRDVTINSLRHSIAVVFQEAGLFNRSIRENICIGRPNATDAEVAAAARQAEAYDFIMRKPGGFDFLIGERGASLSGGERQRLALARAIIKDAPILILDEATSALDVETEARIKRALDAFRRGRTTLIIAHRLSTVADADQILVLDRGRIVERGTFNELVRHGGLFARMVSEGGFTEPRTEKVKVDADLL